MKGSDQIAGAQRWDAGVVACLPRVSFWFVREKESEQA